MMWNDYYGPGPWMMFGPMFLIVMMAVCVVVMFFMMRRRHGASAGDAAAQILKERYARGEIDKAEYEERRRTLES
jgi:putative membrane protein